MNKQEKSKKEIVVYIVGWYRGKGKNKYWQSVAVFDSDYKQAAISWKKELNSNSVKGLHRVRKAVLV